MIPQKYVRRRSRETKCAPLMPTMQVTARQKPTIASPSQTIQPVAKPGSYSKLHKNTENPESPRLNMETNRLIENNNFLGLVDQKYFKGSCTL